MHAEHNHIKHKAVVSFETNLVLFINESTAYWLKAGSIVHNTSMSFHLFAVQFPFNIYVK